MPRARGIPDASKHEAAPMAAPLPRLVALEDDPDCCKLIQACLRADYSTVFANSGAELLRLVDDSAVDVILLDVGLPDDDGFSIARQIRRTSDVPIVFLSGYASEDMIVKGLNIGGGDYVTKPFSREVLVARIRNSLTRISEQQVTAPRHLQLGEVVFHVRERDLVGANGCCLKLTEMESLILLVLAQAGSEPVSRNELFRRIHGREWDQMSRELDVHVSHLRSKLAEIFDTENPLISLRGVGYCLQLGALRRTPKA
jgi:DNA-binding response OmpR family regulator